MNNNSNNGGNQAYQQQQQQQYNDDMAGRGGRYHHQPPPPSSSYIPIMSEDMGGAVINALRGGGTTDAGCCSWWPQFGNNSSIMFIVGICLEIGLTLAFCGLSLYAIIQGNTDAVRAACPKLWEFMVARSIAAVVVTMLIILLYMFIRNTYTTDDDTDRNDPNVEWASMDRKSLFATSTMMYALFISLFVYFAGFFTAAVSIIPSNVPNSNLCVDTLSMTVITGTPILGITAWIACILDGVLAIAIAILIGYNVCRPPLASS